ncbi:putative inactive cadmium/zinc-transporting ATPase HMA3 [Durio zibethinus]|uniref:Inactive cadmium/zinc-transporting ATPase HMA3 n=1 Tax=Durio zibethinus TaxID=66656 RepID=A0A6P5ZMA2_DURZI|nr:putative inactive cadmium/zinc-transporting ATPase HMA3 [Durio zibethinus]
MAANKKLQKTYFDVLGLCCSSEVTLVENILKSLEGVTEVSVIVPTRTVIVLHDNLLVSQLQIVKALNQARLEANVRAHGEIKYPKKWPSPFAVACGLLLLLSFLKYVYHPLQWLAVGAVVIGICPVLLKGYAAITNFRLDINVLMLIAVIGSVAMKDYIEAGTIVFFFTSAEWLESRASHKATAVMSSLMGITPQKAVIADTGEEVDADEVKLNTVLAVRAGEVIPIDGIVVDGECEVDEKSLTGESLPVTKEKDSTVWAGTINLNGYISVKTTAVAEDCVVSKMAKLVEEAQNSKSGTQRFIDKCAQFYTPVIIVVSAAIAVIPAAFRAHNLHHWFHLALVVLVSACPCALILSTPVASFCALTKAATSGLLVKGGDYLEILSKIKLTAFDKTGTLTRGEFVVTDFRSLSEDTNLNTLIYWVSSIESKSSHPMAAALVEYGRSHLIEPRPETVEDFQNFPGEGIYGRIDGRHIYIGSRKISVRAHGTVPYLEDNMMEGKTIGYVFSGATAAGIFSLSDTCRTGVAEAVNELKSMGIKAAMLTGDNQAAAIHVHEQLGNLLDVVHAELLPEDKARIIKEFKKEGPTAMIGDGVNDAPALATADIGISMGISGSALATETGHVILMSNDIRKIPKAIQLARKAHRKVIENVILSISTKVAILALAFAGHPLVWAAVLADVGTCLLVICNSMLLLQGTHKHGGKCGKSSAASHTDKQGCKTSHNHQHASTDKKVQRACEPQQCLSRTCASKCQSGPFNPDSGRTHDVSVNHEAKHCDQGSCNLVNQKIDTDNLPGMFCSGHRRLGLGTEPKDLHGANHCHQGHSRHSSSPDEEDQIETKNDRCLSIHCDENHVKNHTNLKALGNLVEHNFLESLNPKAHPSSHKCCKDYSEPPHTAIDIPMNFDQEAMPSCTSLGKRELGGCCKSYVKECCGKHGHFKPAFGGGLTEMVTE